MPTRWVQIAIEQMCGACERPYPAGTSMKELSALGQVWKKFRCEGCAGETAPAIVEPRVKPIASVVDRMTAIGSMAVQFKRTLKFAQPIRKRVVPPFLEPEPTQPDMLTHLPRRDR